VIGYASRTGTRRNLDALRAAGWRLLLSPKGMMNPLEAAWPYALDNGAWWAFQNQQPFDSIAFETAVERFGPGADFIVVPDIVGAGSASLELSLTWLPRLQGVAPLLIAVQDGMEAGRVAPLIGPEVGIFVGGTTEWKKRTMATWCGLANERAAWSHVGRVNTSKRIALCAHAGATSFDGTSVTRYARNLPKLDGARRQPDLFCGAAR
jgi:hypothetical protein